MAESCQLNKSAITTVRSEFIAEWSLKKAPEKKREKRESDVFHWNKDAMSVYDVCRGIGQHLSGQKYTFYEEQTYNLCRINRQVKGISLITRGKDLSSYLALDFNYKRGYENDDGDFFSADGFQLVPPAVCDTFLLDVAGFSELRKLKLYTTSPVLSAKQLIATPGYHEAAAIYYDGEDIVPAEGIKHITMALNFPYERENGFTDTLGLLIGAVLLRDDFTGNHPAGIIRGDHPNLRKTTLAKTISYISTGRLPGTLCYTEDDLEFEKRVGSHIRKNDFLLIDNIKSTRQINSPFLEEALTSEIIETRILGQSEIMSKRNNIQFFATLNEGSICEDLLTRSVTIFLTHEKKKTIRDPLAYARKHRREILAEIIGMVKNWQAAGCPVEHVHFPKYMEWAALVNGILRANGISGFLSGHRDDCAKLNPEISVLVEVGGAELSGSSSDRTDARPSSYWRSRIEEFDPRFFRDVSTSRGKDSRT
ncbi:MAG: hypothetical protein H6618_06390, partial [Deltaproteobacteria bacterium]|nr:hypothetical protein [Deltaproteobacteria bacterium]